MPEGNGGAPELGAAAVVSGDTVCLAFTEAMAPPGNADPKAFRLSRAFVEHKGDTYYVACNCPASSSCKGCEGHYTDKQICGRAAYDLFGDYGGCEPRTATEDSTLYYDIGDDKFDALTQPSSRHLVGKLGTPFDFGVCAPTPDSKPALYLHYAGSTVRAASGEHLAPIAPAYVGASGNPVREVGLLAGHPVPVDASILDKICTMQACSDGLLDNGETDVDCGGQCEKCADGKTCSKSADCKSDACKAGQCVAATCNDGIKNQGEIGVDCGGPCAPCANNEACTKDQDCASGACVPQKSPPQHLEVLSACGAPSCSDTVRDGNETGIDCGGACGGCVGDTCSKLGDCASGVCTTGACAPRQAATIALGGLRHGSPSEYPEACTASTSGGLSCWGGNSHGELGDGTTIPRLIPLGISGLDTGVTNVAVGGRHTCAVVGGGAQCWGSNGAGQLGDGGSATRLVPGPVSGLASGVASIVAGEYDSCALDTSGAVLCWGAFSQSHTPVAVSGLPTGVQMIGMYADGQFGCALTAAGGVTCWGYNDPYGLGNGEQTCGSSPPVGVVGLDSGVTSISVGYEHACALLASGAISCWGNNDEGQLGDGTTNVAYVPVSVAGLSEPAVAVAAGAFHTCAILASGGLVCWGSNGDGALGDGTTQRRLTPTAVSGLASGVTAVFLGEKRTCAITSGGRTMCWGAAMIGDGTLTNRHTPTGVFGF